MVAKMGFTIRALLSCLFLCFIHFQLTVSQFVPKSSEHSAHPHRNDTLSDLFWQSLSQFEADTDVKFKSIADRIATIRNADFNQSASICYQAVESTLRRGTSHEWAAKLINSNSFLKENLVSSLLSETFTSLGDFETCLSLSDVSTEINNATVTFSGRYCLLSLGTPTIDFQNQIDQGNVSVSTFKLASKWLAVRNRFPLVQAVCFPSICSEEDLVSLIHQYFPKYLKGIKLNIGYCQEQEQPLAGSQFTGNQVIALCILAFFTFLSILGTALHWTINRFNLINISHLSSIASCFDLHRNVKSLFSVSSETQPSHEYNLCFLNGLKAWLMFCVVLTHSFCFMPSQLFSKVSLFSNYPSFYHALPTQIGLLYTYFERCFLFIDFFFIISGFLVTHLVLRHCRQAPNLGFSIFARWVRFVPSVVAILCLTIVLQTFGSGPLFHNELTDPYVAPCVDYWWTHLLFINNWYTIDQMCGANLWFVAADFQLNLLLFVVLFAYFYRRMYGYLTSFVLMGVSFCTLASLVAFGNLGIPRADYPINFDFPAPLNAFRLFYTSPLLHTMSYLSGAFVAFRLHQRKPKPVTSKYTDLLLTICLLVTFGAILCPLPHGPLSRANENTSFTHFLLFTLLYTLIVLGGTGGLYLLLLTTKVSLWKRLLSARITLPLGRLSYGVYLVHPLLIWYNTHQSQQATTLTGLYTLQFFSVIYVQSHFLAIFLYIFFDSPVANLFRHLTKRPVTKQSKPGQENELKIILKDEKESRMSAL